MLHVNLYLDVAIWLILITGFAFCFKHKLAFWSFLIAFVLKAGHSYFAFDEGFLVWADVTFVIALLISVVFARNSPNFRWLTGAILVIAIIEFAVYELFRGIGSLLYWTRVGFDCLLISLIAYRGVAMKSLARKEWPIFSKYARQSSASLAYSRDEMYLGAIIFLDLLLDISLLIEKLIREYTSAYPEWIYDHSDPLKLFISCAGLFICFSISLGYAKGAATGKPVP